MDSDWRIDKDDVLGTNCLRAVGELLARTDRLEAELRERAAVSVQPDLVRRASLAAQHLRDWGLHAEAEEMMDRWKAFYSKWTRSIADFYDESAINLLGRFNQWLRDRLRQWMISAGNTELLDDLEGNSVDQVGEHEEVERPKLPAASAPESQIPAGKPSDAEGGDDTTPDAAVRETRDALSGRTLRFFNYLVSKSHKTYFDELRDDSTVFTKSDISDAGIATGIKELIRSLETIAAPCYVEWSKGDKWVKLKQRGRG